MATELNMPQMGYDMQEGTVVRWLKSEDSEVAEGEPIAEIETDKAVVEVESTASGLLRRIVVPEGTTVPVGQPIAIIGTRDEELPEVEATPVKAASPAADAASIPLPPSPTGSEAEPMAAGEIRASPVAKRLAEERGIDLSRIEGTGPSGRITRADVLAVEPSARGAEAAPAPPVEFGAPAVKAAPGETVPLSRMRQQIARVTVKSKREIPHFYVSAEIDMTRATEMRQHVNSEVTEEESRVSVNDLIIKACVGAMKTYPKFNASFAEEGIQVSPQINVGIAIAEEEGLIVPAIMDCGGKSLAEVARASKDLIDRSKSGTLSSQEYSSGTFTISNMGMFDVSSFAAIIHPPQTAVLAVGTVAKRPVVRDGQVTVAEMMTATLSADHRVSDGAEGARFLMEIKRLLEHPLSLVL